jgi:serine/threonine protein kinase
MDHPNIAKVLDVGTTETGAPFFVMELVKGIPLNEFCDTQKLTIPERLNLFTQICSAVQHAHQKGIIHRDLKPGNILVESHDGKPVPKVIDFGLAEATSGLQLTDQSMFTAFGSVMGTPLYMAPEQASFNAVDVDTRADVYALGVILYELLTGTTPITRDTLKKAALDQMLRLIREKQEPDAWTTFNTQSMLGEALLGLARSASKGKDEDSLARAASLYRDAEPLLLKGYEGMKEREKTIPAQGSTRLPEALDRIIELYTETNKPDEAKKWQAERSKYPEPNEKK